MRGSRKERLLAKVEVDPETGCWLWTGARDHSGYGQFAWTSDLIKRAHRAAYELLIGPIPEGLPLDHLCRVRLCVNPEHLEPVTVAENTRRGLPATKTECVNGHPYDEGNTYLRKGRDGSRDCRACGRERSRRYKQRKVSA